MIKELNLRTILDFKWLKEFISNCFTIAAVVHGFIAFIIFAPFFLQGQIPLWSIDNLYGSYPAIAFSHESFNQGFSRWLPYYLCGIDFTSSINNFTYSPLLLPAYLLPFNYFWVTVAWIQFLSLWAIGFLAFLFFRRILEHDGWALFSATAYQLSQHTLFTFQIFPSPLIDLSFLLCCYFMWTIGEKKKVTSFIILLVSLLGLILSGHFVIVVQYTLVIVILFLYRHGFNPLDVLRPERPTGLFTLALLMAILIGSIRWLPFYCDVKESNRLAAHILESHDVRLYSGIHFFLPEVFGITGEAPAGLASFSTLPGYVGNLHALFLYFGVLPAFFIFLSFFDRKVQGGMFWKILVFFYLAMQLRIMPFNFIANLLTYPFIHGSIEIGGSLFFCILAGYTGKCLSQGPDTVFVRNWQAKGFLDDYTMSPFFNTVILSLIALVVVITYTMAIWLPVWEGHYEVIILGKVLVGAIIAFPLLMYTYRNNERVFYFLRLITFSFLGMCLVSIFVYTLAITLTGKSELYRIAAIANWAAIITILTLVFAVRFSLCSPRFLIFIACLFGVVMIIPWVNPDTSKAYHCLIRINALPFSFAENRTVLFIGICRLLSVFILMILLLYLKARGKITEKILCTVCCVTVFVEMLPVFKESSFIVCRPFVAMEDANLYPPRTDYLNLDLKNYRVNFPHQLIPSSPVHSRVVGCEPQSNIPIVYRIPYYGGVNGQYTKRMFEFFNSMVGSPNTVSIIGVAAGSINERSLDIVGARYDLRSGELNERPSALSRFMLFSDYEVQKDDKEAVQRLKSKDFDPYRTLIINEDIGILETKLSPARPVEYTSSRSDTIELHISTDKEQILLFNDSCRDGWQAYDNGVRLPIHRANFNFMAVAIGQGEHNIKFIFYPIVFRMALFISSVGLALFIIISIVYMRRVPS